MSIAGPRRPPGLPELNALTQVIAIPVNSRPSPDRHPSGSGGVILTLHPWVHLAGHESSEHRTRGLGTWGSGNAIGDHERNRVTEPRLGPTP
jgi:hypothetical protein